MPATCAYDRSAPRFAPETFRFGNVRLLTREIRRPFSTSVDSLTANFKVKV